MSIPLGRRQFLTLPLALLLSPLARAAAESPVQGRYAVDVGILYDVFTFHLVGTIDERIDRAAGTYAVTFAGQGPSIANRLESEGRIRDGRWAPARSLSWVSVRGRQSRTDITYDHAGGRIDYHARGETFFLRRLRVVNDRLTIAPARRVDDVVSAVLNYADGRWPARADGAYVTDVVRRAKRDDEGPDEVAESYHAELVPFELRVTADPTTGRPTAQFDLTRFSSWARPSQPARIVFDDDRRPALITTAMILGSSITIRLRA